MGSTARVDYGSQHAAAQFLVRTPGEVCGPSGSSLLPTRRCVFNCLKKFTNCLQLEHSSLRSAPAPGRDFGLISAKKVVSPDGLKGEK